MQSNVFERNFGLRGREFEQLNLQKFKCPGLARGGGGGMLMFRIDRRIKLLKVTPCQNFDHVSPATLT